MEITIFKDIKVTSQPFYRGALVILNRIKEGASKDLVKRIREEKDKEKINTLKQIQVKSDIRKYLKLSYVLKCFKSL